MTDIMGPLLAKLAPLAALACWVEVGGGGLSAELQDKPFCTPSSLKRDIRELEQEVSGEQALVPRECGGDFSAVLQCLC